MLNWMKVDPDSYGSPGSGSCSARLARYAAGVRHHGGVHRHALLFRTLPAAALALRVARRVVATVLWLLATSGFAWYVRNMAHYNVMYGSVGAGIALLVWMYLMAAIALIGCEFNAELRTQFAIVILIPAYPLKSC